MRRVADGVMGALARVLVHVFFRKVEVEHGEAIAPGVPTVLVANHTNGLVDALLLMSALRRYPRFLGKSTLFRILPLWPFLKLAGVVPVYRAKDGGSTARNSGAFAVCRSLLAGGGMVALFPEGISHDEPSLQPLVGTVPANEGMRATVKLLGCFASFTLLYVALGVVFGTRFGVVAGIVAFVAAPACGYVTVLLSERVKRVGGAVAGARAVRTRGGAVESVLADRRAVIELAQGVVDGSAR